MIQKKVDANSPFLNLIIYCTDFEKQHEESLENAIKDQQTAEKALTKKTIGERLEPSEAQAIHRIKKNYSDVFDNNNEGLVEPTEEDKEQMDEISIDEVGAIPKKFQRFSSKS